MVEVHQESQETYDFIADWIDPNFFYSKKDVWHRFGMLGVFGDYVLSCTNGDIAEIGVGESSIYLAELGRKYGRINYHCDISPGKIVNPMTVKGYLPDSAMFAKEEDGLFDPEGYHVLFVGESDNFFKNVKMPPIALAFIDGDHIYDQVKKDFENMAKLVVENGYIILHDTYPPSEDYLREERCGTVYKLRQEIELDRNYDCITLPVGCAIGVGLTIVRKKPAKRTFYNE